MKRSQDADAYTIKIGKERLAEAAQLPAQPYSLSASKTIIFDTETTGLNPGEDEIIQISIIDGLGNEVMIEYIVAARAFATPHLFSSDGVLPATFTAMEDSTLLTASKESMFKLISEEPKILHNFLCITGNCNVCTVSRLKTLSRKTVRERFVVYLLEHKKKNSSTVNIIHNQATLAEYLNVTRPALSKEINKMIKEGIIEMDGKTVRVLDEPSLEKYV